MYFVAFRLLFLQYFGSRCRRKLSETVNLTSLLSGSCGAMDQREDEDSAVLQINEDQTSDQSVLPTGNQDQEGDKKEHPPQGQEGGSGDEWDTDLETDSRLM